MSDPNCTWIITRDDCDPLHTATPPAPVGPGAPAEPGVLGPPPPVEPTAPPVEHLDGVHLPDLPSVSTIADTTAVATTCGVVIVAMLVMIVAVAARWPLTPHRLRNFAIASLLLPATSALAGGSWSTPAAMLWAGAAQVAEGELAGLRMMLALGAPFAALTATYVWARFVHKTNTVGLKSLARTERVKDALLARQFARAAKTAALGAPLTTHEGIVLGPLANRTSAKPAGIWEELTARHEQWLVIPHKQARRHFALVGTTGSGKTEAIKRYAAGMLEYEWTRYQQWKDTPGMRRKYPRPLLVMVSCKGGADDLALGAEIAEHARCQGIEADKIAAVMPGADRLDGFDMPVPDLRAVFGELFNAGESTTSEGQHFEEMRRRIVSLVVEAPAGPPRTSAEFLDRLDPAKLLDAWGGAPDVKRMIDALQGEKVPQLDDALIKANNLFDALRDADGQFVFDGGKRLDDLDVLFVTVPGLDKDAARAQVAAVIRMVMQRAGRTAKDQRRSVTLIIDEISATTTKSGSIGLVDVCERGRSQGVAVMFAAQSQEGLAADSWSLNRLLKACAGGLVLGYNENAGDLCSHLGTVRSMLPSRHLIKGQRHGDEGQVSVGERWLVDPDTLRQLDTGEFVYARGRRADWGRVIRVTRDTLRPLPGTDTGRSTTEKDTAEPAHEAGPEPTGDTAVA